MSSLLVTGGTGTFGAALLQRTLRQSRTEIRVFSRDEKKQEEMRLAHRDPRVTYYIGDVRSYESVRSAMRGVDVVFHAAALKQVPSCEFHPLEALKTNTIGAENVMNAAIECGVKRVVVLSTDKAVYPINAMGMTKALMEKLMVAKARMIGDQGTVLCGTRYGNVMCSRGSVIPLFIQQIKSGQPLTVTDPHMTRFMMSIEGAVDLVEYALSNGQPGDIFVHKSPAATIETLVLALRQIFQPSSPTLVIGTRHGEKLYETLLTREELARAEDCGAYYRIPSDTRDLNYNLYFIEGEERISREEDYTSHNTRRVDVDEMVSMLLSLDYVKRELVETPE
jgi:UDP-N-acetylglucosamine 4,6-dehydratase/5-epimerase